MLRLSEMSWASAQDAFRKAKVALLPIGAIENHGPHLPLGTDWLSSRQIAEEAAKRGPWLLIPSIPVGVSEHHRQFWGTLWVAPGVLRDYAMGIARSIATYGLRKIVFVNGHGGNTGALNEAIRSLRNEGMHVFLHEWWVAISDVIAEICHLPHDHAGDMETSVMLSINHRLVDKNQYPQATSGSTNQWGRTVHGVHVALDTIEFTKSGVVGDPSGASAEKGERLISVAADRLNEFCSWFSEQSEEALAPLSHVSH